MRKNTLRRNGEFSREEEIERDKRLEKKRQEEKRQEEKYQEESEEYIVLYAFLTN